MPAPSCHASWPGSRETHARVHVNVVCQPSVDLLRRLADRRGRSGAGHPGQRRARRHRAAAASRWSGSTSAAHRAHEQDPLPLATVRAAAAPSAAPPRRAWRQRPGARRSPTPASASPASMPHSRPGSRSACCCAAASGRACASSTQRDGFPPLPEAGITLQRAPARALAAGRPAGGSDPGLLPREPHREHRRLSINRTSCRAAARARTLINHEFALTAAPPRRSLLSPNQPIRGTWVQMVL